MCKEEKHFEIVELDSSKMYTKRNHFTLAQRILGRSKLTSLVFSLLSTVTPKSFHAERVVLTVTKFKE